MEISEGSVSSSSSRTDKKEDRLDAPMLEQLPIEEFDMRLELLPLLCRYGDSSFKGTIIPPLPSYCCCGKCGLIILVVRLLMLLLMLPNCVAGLVRLLKLLLTLPK